MDLLAAAQTQPRNQVVSDWPASAQATAQQRKRRPAEALEEAEAEAEPERPAWAVKRARTARAEWDDLLAEAHLAKAAVERAASAKAAKAQAEDAYTDSFADGYAHAAKPRRKTPRGSPPPRPRKARTAAARPQAARPPLPPLPPPPLPPPPPSTPAKAELAVAACYAAWRANEPVMPCSRVEAALAASAGPGEMAADDTALLEDLPPVGLAGALSGIDWAVRVSLPSPTQVSPFEGSLWQGCCLLMQQLGQWHTRCCMQPCCECGAGASRVRRAR